MASIATLKDTLGIINAAAGILDSNTVKTGVKYGGKAIGVAQRISETGGALTQFSAQTTILSRVFIDQSVTDEIVLPNLMKSLHEWYAAQIISALHLSRMVDSKRTVQDVMNVLQTGQNDRQQSLLGNVLARTAGQESFLANYLGEAACESLVLVTQDQVEEMADLKNKQKQYDTTTHHASLRSVNASESRIGPMGELYEVTLTNPTNKELSVKVPLYVQMQPSIVPADVAPRFIDMNVSPSIWQRWTQMRAGELAFWKDFILHRDLIQRQRSVVKDPRTAAAFNDFLKTVAKKDKYALADVTDKSTAARSSNLANSVVIFSEDTVAQAKADSAIDLHNDRDRQRYFRDTYSMSICIVDTIHQRVTIYFNGLDGSIDSSYSDFKPKDSKFDPKDFMTALTAFSNNSVGRLR